MPTTSRVTVLARGSVLLFGCVIAALVMILPRSAHPAGDGVFASSQAAQESLAKPTQVAKIEATKGWATFGLALPAGLAWESLKVGSEETQADVKTRWPDRSIRFCVV